MDVYSIIGIAVSLCLAGVGVGIGARLLQLRRTSVATEHEGADEDSDTPSKAMRREEHLRRRLYRPAGKRRATSIHGINERAFLRHTDGSYTRAYAVERPATLYADDVEVDRLYNDFARMLQSVGVAGVVLQLRCEVWADSGRAIKDHIKAQAQGRDTYMPARMLHTVGLTGTESLAREGLYRDDCLTLWVRVLARHASDPSGSRFARLMRVFPSLIKEIRKRGVARLGESLGAGWTRGYRETLVARALSHEHEACERAAQTFSSIEGMCPLPLRPFTREELWRETFLAHRLNERSAPALIDLEGADLRQPLCGEEISGDGHFLLHGNVPVSIVSLFRPPTPAISAGMLRVMTANPNLTFRHTTIVEYVTLDQEKAKAHLKSQHKDLSRAQTAVSRKSPTPAD
ncbi:MAG: hypothetical protein LC742_11380, partial [Acidobacteria bacterium]|nr:hypothetical protein [Acidobacteriota bacterium]